MIQYSDDKQQWEWDLARIETETDVSEHLVGMVMQNLESLDRLAKAVLSLAASLGYSHFDVHTVTQCLEALQRLPEKEASPLSLDPSTEINAEQINVAIAVLESNGFVEKVSDGRFKFSHDKVREGAQKLAQGPNYERTHLIVGRKLREMLEKEHIPNARRERLVLQTVRQINKAIPLIQEPSECSYVITINRMAADLCRDKAWMFAAVDFLQIAVEQLGPNAWKKEPEITLAVKSDLAELYYTCGRVNASLDIIDDILEHTSTFEQQRVALFTQSLCLRFLGKDRYGLGTMEHVLVTIGRPIPKRMLLLHTFLKLHRITKSLKGRNNEDLMDISDSTDKKDAFELDCCEEIAETCLYHYTSEKILPLYALIRPVQITATHGRVSRTSSSLAAWAMIQMQLGNISEGERFGQIALHYANQQRYPKHDHRTIGIHCFFIRHWTRPLHESLRPLVDVYTYFWKVSVMGYVLSDTGCYFLCYMFFHLHYH